MPVLFFACFPRFPRAFDFCIQSGWRTTDDADDADNAGGCSVIVGMCAAPARHAQHVIVTNGSHPVWFVWFCALTPALEWHSHRIAAQRIASRRIASFIKMTNSQIISLIFRYIWIRSMQMRTRICGLRGPKSRTVLQSPASRRMPCTEYTNEHRQMIDPLNTVHTAS